MFIILDRDGVINKESPAYIKTPEEWHPIPGSLEAIAKLKHAGATVVVATNQSGIARGLYTEKILQEIHLKMTSALEQLGVSLDGIFFCPHLPEDHCACRKPAPGLLLEISRQFKVDLKTVYCIGDSLRDIEAAMSVGAKPILVLTGNGHRTSREMNDMRRVPVFNDLCAAVDYLLCIQQSEKIYSRPKFQGKFSVEEINKKYEDLLMILHRILSFYQDHDPQNPFIPRIKRSLKEISEGDGHGLLILQSLYYDLYLGKGAADMGKPPNIELRILYEECNALVVFFAEELKK